MLGVRTVRGLRRLCIVLGLLLAAWSLLTAASAPAPTLRLRVGVYENMPKIGVEADGRAQGVFVDVIETIARAEGWAVEYVNGTWAQGLARLDTGEIDLMPDVAWSPARAQRYDFHQEAVLSSWAQVYARRDTGVRSLPDLDGMRVAVLDGSVQQDAFDRMVQGFGLRVELLRHPDYAAAFRSVSQGRADAVITNRFYGLTHAREAGLEDTAIVFEPSRLHFAALRGQQAAALQAIDRHLAQLKADRDSAYYRSLARWTGDVAATVWPRWLAPTMAAALATLVVAFAWGVTLRRQVAARTLEVERLYVEQHRHALELEQRVEQRTDELAGANRDLQQAKEAAEAADRIKSAFLATMSHELRTPLNSIIGFTGVMLQGLAGPLNPEQHKQMTMVRDSARHLLALINDVLDISKIEAGQLELARLPFDLGASLQRVADIARPLAETKGLVLTVQVDPALGSATGDARRVEQVVLNLLSNAVKFTERGSVTLRAEPATLASARGDETAAVRIAVSDTGIGIRDEDRELLFRPFRQIDSRLSREHEGTGLGLSICRRLCELMKGTIDVHSRWQQGSTFTVTLPLEVSEP